MLGSVGATISADNVLPRDAFRKLFLELRSIKAQRKTLMQSSPPQSSPSALSTSIRSRTETAAFTAT